MIWTLAQIQEAKIWKEEFMKKLGFLLILLFPIFALGQGPAPKKRIAVVDFDYGSVQRWWGEGTWDIGKGISDLIVEQLMKDGTYRLVERKNLDKLLAEQNFSNSQRADGTTAAKTGKLLGVNAMIVGSVTQFGTENKESKIGGILGRLPGLGALGGAAVGKQKGKAKVGITARILDVITGEILLSVTGTGESSRSGWLLGGGGVGGGGFGIGGISMSSSDFRETILGEATYAAVAQLVQGLLGSYDKIPMTKLEIRGVVADVNGLNVVLNVGAAHGVQVGDALQIFSISRVIKDPVTGDILRRETVPIGEVRIAQADDRSSSGTVPPGTVVKVGDLVQNK